MSLLLAISYQLSAIGYQLSAQELKTDTVFADG
jgi:hypothetical protein